jgi:hypothetical protein
MSTWNYRILFDGTDFWVGEVYYESDTPVGYTGPSTSTLAWDNLKDLAGTIDYVVQAKDRPVLRVDAETEAIIGTMTDADLAAAAASTGIE